MIRFFTVLLIVLSVSVLSTGCMAPSGAPQATNPLTESSPSDTTDAPIQETEASSTTDPDASETTGSDAGTSDTVPPSTDRNGFPNLPQDDATKRY